MTRTVAFLRGINLGKRRIKMDDLRQSFERAGFGNVETLLASGNVLFDGNDEKATAEKIEAFLQKDFGFEAETILRTLGDLQKLVASDPFSGRIADKNTKFYVYFFARPETEKLDLSTSVPEDYEIVRINDREIFAIGHRLPEGRFGSGLDKLPRPFSRHMTARNWETVRRLTSGKSA